MAAALTMMPASVHAHESSRLIRQDGDNDDDKVVLEVTSSSKQQPLIVGVTISALSSMTTIADSLQPIANTTTTSTSKSYTAGVHVVSTAEKQSKDYTCNNSQQDGGDSKTMSVTPPSSALFPSTATINDAHPIQSSNHDVVVVDAAAADNTTTTTTSNPPPTSVPSQTSCSPSQSLTTTGNDGSDNSRSSFAGDRNNLDETDRTSQTTDESNKPTKDDDNCRHSRSSSSLVTEKQSSIKKISNTHKRRRRRHVTFSTVQIRRYPMLLGDNPAVLSGPPVTLGWEYEVLPDMSVIDFETFRLRSRRLHSSHLILSHYKRIEIIQRCGHTAKEIKAVEKEMSKIKRQRNMTVALSPLSPFQNLAESAGRKVRGLGKGMRRK
jgi:hypothetical protein